MALSAERRPSSRMSETMMSRASGTVMIVSFSQPGSAQQPEAG